MKNHQHHIIDDMLLIPCGCCIRIAGTLFPADSHNSETSCKNPNAWKV